VARVSKSEAGRVPQAGNLGRWLEDGSWVANRRRTADAPLLLGARVAEARKEPARIMPAFGVLLRLLLFYGH